VADPGEGRWGRSPPMTGGKGNFEINGS